MFSENLLMKRDRFIFAKKLGKGILAHWDPGKKAFSSRSGFLREYWGRLSLRFLKKFRAERGGTLL